MTSEDLAAHVAALAGGLTCLQQALAPEQAWRATDEQVLDEMLEFYLSALRP